MHEREVVSRSNNASAVFQKNLVAVFSLRGNRAVGITKDKAEIVESNKRNLADIRKNDDIVKIVKTQYKNATSQAEQDVLRNQMTVLDLKFLQNLKSQEYDKVCYLQDKNVGFKPVIEFINISTQIIEEYCRWSIPDLNKAIELDPNSDVYRLRGIAYNNLEQYDQALQDLNKALELNPNNAYVHYNRGVVYTNLGQYELAIQDFNQSTEAYVNKAFAYANRAFCYLELEQYDQALQDLNKAIELDPNYSTAYRLRAGCYFKLGESEKMNADLDKYNELSDKS